MKKYILCNLSTGEKHEFENELSIGRKQGDLVLGRNMHISSAHCKISIIANKIYIEDLGARNPSFVGSDQLKPNEKRFIKEKEIVYLGKIKYQVYRKDLKEDSSTTKVFNINDMKEENDQLGFFEYIKYFFSFKRRRRGDNAHLLKAQVISSSFTAIYLFVDSSNLTMGRLIAMLIFILSLQLAFFIFFIIEKRIIKHFVKKPVLHIGTIILFIPMSLLFATVVQVILVLVL